MSKRAISENKDKYIDVATKCFARSGFDGVSIRDICKITGTSVSSLYYHFKNKEELYKEVFCRQFNPLEKKLEEEVKRYCNPQDKLSALVSILVNELSENDNLWRLLMHISIESSCNDFQEVGHDSFIKCFTIFYEVMLSIIGDSDFAYTKTIFAFSLCLIPFQGKDIWPIIPGYINENCSTEKLKDMIVETILNGIILKSK